MSVPQWIALVGLVFVLAAANERFVEKFFGTLVSGKIMVWVSFVSGFGITFAARSLADIVPVFDPLANVSFAATVAVGFFVAAGSDFVHALFDKYLPATKANKTSLL